jgi:hypothetical protein
MTETSKRINELSKRLMPQVYLEIGVEKGLTFFNVDATKKIAVDPNFRFNPKDFESESMHFKQMESDKFFESHDGTPFDLVFLDGLHHYEQTLRDLMNVLVYSHKNSVILIDDVVPSDVFSSLRAHGDAIDTRKLHNLSGEAWHGDVFKCIFYLHDFLPALSYATIEEAGCNHQTVVWKKPRTEFKPLFNDLEKIARLNYFDLIKNFSFMNCGSSFDIFSKVFDDLNLSK